MRVVLVISVLVILVFYILFLQPKNLYNIKKELVRYKRIPKIIFKTHHTMTVPKYMFEKCHKNWEKLNPEYSIFWYSTTECENILKKYPRIYRALDSLNVGAYKADLWRAVILYKYGGVYVDSYTIPYNSLAFCMLGCIHESKHQFIAIHDSHSKKFFGIHNGFLIVTPKHPFLKQYISDMLENIETQNYGENDLDITGPYCLWKSICKVLHTDSKFKVGWNNYGELSFYLYKFSDSRLKHVYKDDKEKIMILQKKYSMIHLFCQKVVNLSSTYYWKWKNKKVFKIRT